MSQQRDLLPYLIQIAESNLPQLKHEIDVNGATIFKLQAAVAEMHTIMTYLVHHMIDERRRLLMVGAPATFVAPAPAPAPAPAVPRPAPQPQRQVLPPLDRAAPIAPQAMSPGPGASASIQGPVLDVTITPTGTRVSLPGAAAPLLVPPGAHVDATLLTEGAQPPEGVILPPGGSMSPEAAAALGARNVTSDPPPQG